MTRGRVVTALLAAAALVVGVVAVRDGTAVQAGDLAPPSPAPSVEAVVPPSRSLVLGPEGLAGLPLGTPAGERTEGAWGSTPAGCTLAPVSDLPTGGTASDARVGWELTAWEVDGDVAALILMSYPDLAGHGADVVPPRTWLGPTLGSSIEEARRLDDARVVVRRPFGARGPMVTVVTVPAGDVDVVFTDAYDGPGQVPDGTTHGTITTVELRRPDARACELADMGRWPDGLVGAVRGGRPVVDLDGTAGARFGSPFDEVVEDGPFVEDDAPVPAGAGADRCRVAWSEQDGLRVVALDGEVVQVGAWGAFATSFGVRGGMPADELATVLPDSATTTGDLGSGSGSTVVVIEGATVVLDTWPAVRTVSQVERPVGGGPLQVQGVTVTAAGTDPALVGC